MQNVTTVVFAHGDAIETVYRHLPIWKKYTDNLLIVSPIDNQVFIPGEDCLCVEKRQHHGNYALRRILFTMKMVLAYASDVYVFLEYDALLLKRPVARPIIQGNLFNSQVISKRQQEHLDAGLCFLHFPWIFPADKLKEFTEKVHLSLLDNVAHDVWLIQKLFKLGMSVHNLLSFSPESPNAAGEGFSRNSITTPEEISNLSYHLKSGAYALHGIKTFEALKPGLEAIDEEDFSADVCPLDSIKFITM